MFSYSECARVLYKQQQCEALCYRSIRAWPWLPLRGCYVDNLSLAADDTLRRLERERIECCATGIMCPQRHCQGVDAVVVKNSLRCRNKSA